MRIATHCLFVLLGAIGWTFVGYHSPGILGNILVVVGSLHLGAVAHQHWPNHNE